MCNDIHQISEHMASIDEGVNYFRGYVERQEEGEMRRIQQEEKWAMREAREYEERRQMNELIWQQFEAIRQLHRHYHPFPSDQGSSSTFTPFPPHFWMPLDQRGPVTVSCILHPSLTRYSFLHFQGSFALWGASQFCDSYCILILSLSVSPFIMVYCGLMAV